MGGWWGVNIDDLGFTVVELNQIDYKSDCFILDDHAKQVLYIKYQVDNRKSIVCSVKEKVSYYSSGDVCDDIDVYAPFSNKFPLCNLNKDDVVVRVPIDEDC